MGFDSRMFVLSKTIDMKNLYNFTQPMKKMYPSHVRISILTLCLLLATFIGTQAQVTISITNDTTICSGTPVQLNATPLTGTPPFMYQWSPAAGLNNPAVVDPVATATSTTTYTVTVTDNTSATATAQVTINVLPSPAVSGITTTPASCNGTADGTICVTATGGSAPYLFDWSSGQTTTSNCITLAGGTYRVSVTDINGCKAVDSAIITQPAPIVVNFTTTDATCYGIANGAIVTQVTGGCGSNYTYMWNNGSTTQNQIWLNALTYVLTVTDCNGCSATESAIIQQPDTLTIDTMLGNNISCFGSNNGSICPQISGGTPPYLYFWNNNSVSQCITNLIGGTYTLTLTDGNNCTAIAACTIQEATEITFTVTTADDSCYGANHGLIAIDAAGGVPPYQYSIDNGLTYSASDSFNLLSPQGYDVVVKDSLGCTASLNTHIYPYDPLKIDSIVITDMSCNGATGSVCAYTSGQVSQNLTWSNSASGTCISNLQAGNYSVTVTDNTTTCSVTATATVNNFVPITVTITSSALGTLPDTLTVSVTGGTPPYAYQWSNSVSTQQNIVTQFGLYYLTVTDANTCFTIDSTFVGCPDTCVWPGDADYSGTVDNNDLLAIGLGYGHTGTTRAQQDINWYAHSSTSWANNLPSGDNLKHADCNGDGTINDADTLAILQNYSLTHPRSGADVNRGNVAQLKVIMVPDTLEDGQTVIAHLLLGDTNFAATNVYGLAFTFNYDPLVVDSNEVSLTFNNASWLCSNATDHLDIDKPFYQAGQIKTAITRIDHTTRSGNGEIGQVNMKITTGNINGKNLEYYTMANFISDLIVIDSAGNHLQFDAGADSATIQYEPLGISNLNWNGEVDVYPNPTTNLLNIKSGNLPINSITIVNLLGETAIYQTGLNEKQVQLNTSTLPQGTYIMKLQSGKQMYYTRFVKAQ